MAQVLSHRTVVRDGWHNMCSDLCFWRDTFWLVYDRTSAHSAPDGVVVLLRSADLGRWDEVAVFRTPNDARDAKLAATDDELFVFCADSRHEPVAGRKREVIYSYVFVSDDGYRWAARTGISGRNYWMWRVCLHEGVFYCAEKGGELLSSQDGRSWTFVSRIPSDPEGASPQELREARALDHRSTPRFNEADVIFLYRSPPPYQEWSCVDLETMIHCPALCESGGKVYVAGRRDPTAPWISQHSPAGNTGIFQLDRDGLTPVLALPSDGDAAYPGLLSLEAGRLIVSYYSQHAYLSGAIEGEKKRLYYIERWGALRREAPPPGYGELSYSMSGPSDIFVAEIDLEAENGDTSF